MTKTLGIFVLLVYLLLSINLAAETGHMSFFKNGVVMIDTNKNDIKRVNQEINCSNEGTVNILTIDPPVGTILKVGSRYTFTLSVKYELNTSSSGQIGINSHDKATYRNLDNQTQEGAPIDSKTGEKIVTVITDISLDGIPVKDVVVNASLFPEGYNCTFVNDAIYYSTDATDATLVPIIMYLLN